MNRDPGTRYCNNGPYSLNSIDDILADSDSDSGVEDERKNRSKKKGLDTYIKESEDNIVDLADLDAIGKITSM